MDGGKAAFFGESSLNSSEPKTAAVVGGLRKPGALMGIPKMMHSNECGPYTAPQPYTQIDVHMYKYIDRLYIYRYMSMCIYIDMIYV